MPPKRESSLPPTAVRIHFAPLHAVRIKFGAITVAVFPISPVNLLPKKASSHLARGSLVLATYYTVAALFHPRLRTSKDADSISGGRRMLVTKSREELKVSPPHTSLGELPEEDPAHPRNEISASPLTFPQQDFPYFFSPSFEKQNVLPTKRETTLSRRENLFFSEIPLISPCLSFLFSHGSPGTETAGGREEREKLKQLHPSPFPIPTF